MKGMDAWWLIATLGLGAGALTTVAGMGGGLLLVLSLSLLLDPRLAVAATALPLLVGNLHRAYLFRRELAWRHVGLFAAGAVPAALVAASFLDRMPVLAARCLMIALVAVAVAKATGLWRGKVPQGAMLPGGVAVGGLTAASGAAVMTAPLLMSAGLRGGAYIATASAAAASIHLARLTGYGAAGLVDVALLGISALLAVSVIGGNALGRNARRRLGDARSQRLEVGVLLVCAALAFAGL
jgi:uncharacterized protein